MEQRLEIIIGNKQYNVKEAKTEQELKQGLKGVTELKEDEGMLFYLTDKSSQEVFTMEDMKIPIDIIFINQDQEVIYVAENCQPGQKRVVSSTENLDEDDYIAYVLEVNPNSKIKVGDDLDFEEDNNEGPVMKVLAQDGSTQMLLFSGERIISRRETRILIKKAKKADLSKEEKDYRALGRYMFKVIKGQDTRKPEYVENPK